MALDDGDSSAHAGAAFTYLASGAFDLADEHSEWAVSLNPNDWHAAQIRGIVRNYLGDHEAGIDWVLKAMRLNPLHPASLLESLFDAYYMARRYENALEAFRRWPNPPAHMVAEAAACHAQLGQMAEARDAMRRAAAIRAPADDAVAVARLHLELCKLPEDRQHWSDGYRKAGIDV